MRHARFYRLATYHPDMGCQVSWHRLRRDALAELNRVRKEAIANEIDIQPASISKVEIELSTDGLVGWLNRNFTADNG